MADRRGVRASSRRKTPTPQPLSKSGSPQNARATRTQSRALRSVSRELPDVVKPPKNLRQDVRQASVASATDEGAVGVKVTRRSKRVPAQQTLGDLTTVAEIEVPSDTEGDTEEIPGTPPQIQRAELMAFPSPGALSEMSGTTAITSFSMVEAEFLEPKYILKRMRKLCDSADQFLQHLAPQKASLHEDLYHMQELQKPDAEYTTDYRDLDDEFNINLRHYKTEERNYIHISALHRALFGPEPVAEVSQSGLNLALYLANLLIFARQMMPSDRESKDVWDALRQLDSSFPSHFLSAVDEAGPTVNGATALREDTFNLALELRTQLVILVLERDPQQDPSAILAEVFHRTEASQSTDGSLLRGWNVVELGKDDAPLPADLREKVEQRLFDINECFSVDAGSLDREERTDLIELRNTFPWEPTVLRLIGWVRKRHAELSFAIESIGGPATIVENVKQYMEDGPPILPSTESIPLAQVSPRRRRSSFGRNRRRSSRKFDPNAPVDVRTIDALKAKEQARVAAADIAIVPQDEDIQPINEEMEARLDQDQQFLGNEDDAQVALAGEEPLTTELASEVVPEQTDEPNSSGPPQSSAALLKMAKELKPQKENRPVSLSLFDRQANAQRVEFGDGFDDSQPTPGSSASRTVEHPASKSEKKRTRGTDGHESEDDAFQAADRGARVQERRERAPVTKKVRIDPTSSGAPPSHQPPPRSTLPESVPIQQEDPVEQDSVSEHGESPEMTEEPPMSTYQRQKILARQNRTYAPSNRDRRTKRSWSAAEEEALLEYMADMPTQYANILKADQTGEAVLQDRSQVDLKDKARTMAINMIKSKTGVMPGFEGVIKPSTKIGRDLIEQGYDEWW